MAFKDILLVLITYPQATDASEIQEAVSFAVALDFEFPPWPASYRFGLPRSTY